MTSPVAYDQSSRNKPELYPPKRLPSAQPWKFSLWGLLVGPRLK
ncbi:hypothetical protein PS903_05946 [Pseudomonas fluorescens]|nr:hypothetical protein PS903_05946 [Pseudomonas fluorescens]